MAIGETLGGLLSRLPSLLSIAYLCGGAYPMMVAALLVVLLTGPGPVALDRTSSESKPRRKPVSSPRLHGCPQARPHGRPQFVPRSSVVRCEVAVDGDGASASMPSGTPRTGQLRVGGIAKFSK
ncbi:hypothetical protein [Streptomyces ardesiacus]|uniref:hypothetical protein n=1 Tax=Streptomyces ardesiacus TaxID=285564 RepID=UPI0036EEB37C